MAGKHPNGVCCEIDFSSPEWFLAALSDELAWFLGPRLAVSGAFRTGIPAFRLVCEFQAQWGLSRKGGASMFKSRFMLCEKLCMKA